MPDSVTPIAVAESVSTTPSLTRDPELPPGGIELIVPVLDSDPLAVTTSGEPSCNTPALITAPDAPSAPSVE